MAGAGVLAFALSALLHMRLGACACCCVTLSKGRWNERAGGECKTEVEAVKRGKSETETL